MENLKTTRTITTTTRRTTFVALGDPFPDPKMTYFAIVNSS